MAWAGRSKGAMATLEAIVKEASKQIRSAASFRAHHRQLRAACDEVNQLLARASEVAFGLERYFHLFPTALSSRSSEVAELALEFLDKLISRGFVKAGVTVELQQGEATSVVALAEVLPVLICDATEDRTCASDAVGGWGARALLSCVAATEVPVHGELLLRCVRVCWRVHLKVSNTNARSQSAMRAAFKALDEIFRLTFTRMETAAERWALGARNVGGEAWEETDETGGSKMQKFLPCMYPETHRALRMELLTGSGVQATPGWHFSRVETGDAYAVLREICLECPSVELKTKSNSKILSLQLLLPVLEDSGPAFRCSPPFVECVRSYVSTTLLKRCTSQDTAVVSLALRIFVALMAGFKDHLKEEIEVYVVNLFLRILESEHSSAEHKILVLKVFQNLCSDSAVLVEIFLNYDCDMEAIDLYKRIVRGLEKVAKGGMIEAESSSKKAKEEATSLCRLGMEALTAVGNSLVTAAQLDVHADDCSSVSNPTSPKAPFTGASFDSSDFSIDLESSDSLQPLPSPGRNADSLKPSTSSVKEQFDIKQRRQAEIESGIIKINLNPARGIAHLHSKGLLNGDSAEDVALFFLTHSEQLNKTVVGEYLGRERHYKGGFAQAVLHAYVDALDFRDMEFDLAIRHFLSGFRLPGEAQKIDRIMEKFAERYCSQNPGAFPSADTAFILGFSIIMLNTDLHNPAIKEERRMTKEGFILNNRGISAGQDIDDKMLGAIYDRILDRPIALQEDQVKRRGSYKAKATSMSLQELLPFVDAHEERRRAAFLAERQDMIKAGEARLSKAGGTRKRATSKSYISTGSLFNLSDQAGPMFEIAWGPVLAACSQILEGDAPEGMVDLCLQGFKQAVRVAGGLELSIPRETFVNSLCKFTLLETADSTREMQPKHLQCCQALLDIAVSDGNVLKESWGPVLRCCSQLALMQLTAAGVDTDDAFFAADTPTSPKDDRGDWDWIKDVKRTFVGDSPPATPSRKRQQLNRRSFDGGSAQNLFKIGSARDEELQAANANAVSSYVGQMSIDRIYVRTKDLTGSAIRHFVHQLIAVSRMEIWGDSSPGAAAAPLVMPRVFSLQKLVEVADHNMDHRNRLDWSHMWGGIAGLLGDAGCVPGHRSVALYAVDCLRQLALKFLKKEELRSFNFQRNFLGPFETIITKSPNSEVREMVVRSIGNVVAANATNIRSGWATLLSVLTVAAGDKQRQVVEAACDVLDDLVPARLPLLQCEYHALLRCLIAMVHCQLEEASLTCIGHIRSCAQALAAGTVEIPKDERPPLQMEEDQNVSLPSKLRPAYDDGITAISPWWLLLSELAASMGDTRMDVRSAGLSIIRDVLIDLWEGLMARVNPAHLPGMWECIFDEVLFPLMRFAPFDYTNVPRMMSELPTQGDDQPIVMDSWTSTMVPQIFDMVVEIYLKNFDTARHALPRIAEFLQWYIGQQHVELMARLAAKALHHFIRELPCVEMGGLTRLRSAVAIMMTSSLSSDFGGTLPLLRCPWLSQGQGNEGNSTNPGEDLDLGIQMEQFSAHPCMTHLVMALRLQPVLYDLLCIHRDVLTAEDTKELLLSLRKSYRRAYQFNYSISLRQQLSAIGFMHAARDEDRLPHLLDQETQGISCLLAASLCLCGVHTTPDDLLELQAPSGITANGTGIAQHGANGSSSAQGPAKVRGGAAHMPRRPGDGGKANAEAAAVDAMQAQPETAASAPHSHEVAYHFLQADLMWLLKRYAAADELVQAPAQEEPEANRRHAREEELRYLIPLVLGVLKALMGLPEQVMV
ncbi:unnamed protein product [Chrysoparadoxa australica]